MRGPLLVTVVVAFAAGGCSSADSREPGGLVCTANFVYGLAVTVQDKATSERVCDAEVVALAGSYRETLQGFGPPESCTYSGAGERPDVYELQASRAGFQVATVADVRVGADECHVIPARVTMEIGR
jgi:hypothetical protein